MFKKILIPTILLCVVAGYLFVPVSTSAQTPPAPAPGAANTPGPSATGANVSTPPETVSNIGIPSIFGTIFGGLFSGIGYVLMTLSGFILYLVGTFFDLIVQYSILDMAKHMGNPSGLGAGITAAWATLRDIANMCFIFVLIYAAFKAMFDLNFGNTGETIKNIIIIALLINFSLFFSKVVIDASNVVAIGFYKSIVTVNAPATAGGAETASLSGISGGYMRLLGLQTFYDASIFKNITSMEPQNILIVGIMSSIFFLVTAVILLVSAIMFVARFVILIFLMILSPVALVAYAIPNQQKRFQEWLNALIEQSFFAPLFFALTWVTFKLAASLLPSMTMADSFTSPKFIDVITTGGKSGSITLVLNYVIVLGFAIATLVFAKKMAMQSSSLTRFDKITGGIMGGAAWGMRQTAGRGANAVLQSSTMRNLAKDGKWGTQYAARAGLWTAQKGSKGTFDVRGVGNTAVAKALGGDEIFKGMGSAGGKGGFAAMVDTKAKAKAQYAKDVYGQTPSDKIRDEERKKALETNIDESKAKDEGRIKTERKNKVEVAREEHKINLKKKKDYEEAKLSDNYKNLDQLKKDRKSKEEELQRARKGGASEITLKSIKEQSESLSRSIEIENENIKEGLKKMEENDVNYISLIEATEETSKVLGEAKKNLASKIKESDYNDEIAAKIKELKEFKSSGNLRQVAYAKRVGSGIFGWTAGNQASQRKIEEQAKEKSSKDKLSEAAKALIKEEESEKEEKEKPKEETKDEPKTETK